jgi:hypothetical protein
MSTPAREETAELERLRHRVAELEAELIETRAWANEALGEAQERTYWLDRWHVDLNRLLDRKAADRLRAVARAVRSVFRAARKFKRRLLP